MPENSVLNVWHVSKRFGETLAVDEVSFAVDQGQFVSVLGPSGCGKSTILKMIAGFLENDTGRVSLRGRDMANVPAEDRQIGMVFQNYALFPHLTVGQNVAYGLKVRRRPKAEIAAAVRDKLALVGLDGFAGRYPSQLSGGQMQRVALARALAIEPSLLLMDEPLTALDKKIRDELRVQLRQFQQSLRIPTLFVTHDQVEALTMSDWIILLSNGRIVQASSPDDLYERPMSAFAARFIGENNEFAVRRHNPDTALWGEARWKFSPENTAGDCDGECLAFVRPEDMRFGQNTNMVQGVCEFISVEDSLVKYRLRTLDGAASFVVARTRHAYGDAPALGEVATVGWPRTAVRLIGEPRA